MTMKVYKWRGPFNPSRVRSSTQVTPLSASRRTTWGASLSWRPKPKWKTSQFHESESRYETSCTKVNFPTFCLLIFPFSTALSSFPSNNSPKYMNLFEKVEQMQRTEDMLCHRLRLTRLPPREMWFLSNRLLEVFSFLFFFFLDAAAVITTKTARWLTIKVTWFPPRPQCSQSKSFRALFCFCFFWRRIWELRVKWLVRSNMARNVSPAEQSDFQWGVFILFNRLQLLPV